MINWIEKQHKVRSHMNERNVGVSVSKPDAKQQRIWFYIGERAAEALLDGGAYEFVRVGTDLKNGKVYFDRAECDDGYKVMKKTGRASVSFTADDGMYRSFSKRVGDYPLYYDKMQKLYFIIIDLSMNRGATT